MTREKAPWRLVFLSYPCPTCGAPPGQNCITYNGHPKNECHVDRARDPNRCPNCGDRVSAETPGDLCDRCRLVRALEVERASVYRRRT